MTEIRFAGSDDQQARRRRLMNTTESESQDHSSARNGAAGDDLASVPFSALSRDRLIRKLISPRLWKHITVSIVLIVVPALIAISFVTNSTWTSATVESREILFSDALRALTALELFVAAQLAVLIGWVRSASAVDFRGRFRCWHWMAGMSFAASAMLLTRTFQISADVIAAMLQPIIGTLQASRPALIVVPAAALLLFILRCLIPDMGRCRSAQILLLCSLTCAGLRWLPMWSTLGTESGLASLELLATGMFLSAIQLHARFVIHVNPHPPAVVVRHVVLERTSPGVPTRPASQSARPVARSAKTNAPRSEPEAAVAAEKTESCSPIAEVVAFEKPQPAPIGALPVKHSGNKSSKKQRRRAG